MHINLSSILDTNAALRPDHIAVIDGERRLTYRELNRLASRIALGLIDHGIGVGDVVGLTAPNSIEFIASFYGVLKTGAAIMPLNFLLRSKEIAEQLEFSEATAYLCHPGFGPLKCGEEGYTAFRSVDTCQHFWRLTLGESAGPEDRPTLGDLIAKHDGDLCSVAVDGNSTAIVSFTSGTTGSPKAVLVSHAAEYMNIMGAAIGFSISPTDVMLAVVPLFTSIAQALILGPMITVGGTLVLEQRFDADSALDVIARNRATLFVGVPTMCYRLAERADERQDFDQLREHWRLTIYGGATMSPEIRQKFSSRVGVPLQQAYGLTETRLTGIGRIESAGHTSPDGLYPAPGYHFRVVDAEMNDLPIGEKGELVFRGPGVTTGYLKNKELTDLTIGGGWYHSGDVVVKEASGAYVLVGRIKDIISRGGYKVYPADVEAVLLSHPQVKECVVAGIPDDEYGEEIAAAFVLVAGANLDISTLTNWIRQELPLHNQPRRLRIVESLPLTPTGKVQKAVLLSWFDT